ncbi:uncharacterized protein [Euwallacea similis]|uniref:uncharacterized protein n=1 Tax=Euwallacea similis TaxID=1736056 RepID=UPI00344FE61A
MKFCLVFAATLALAFGTPVSVSKALTASDEDLARFIDALHRFTEDGKDFDLVNLRVNILVDDVLDNMRDILIEHHLNVIELRDENVELPEQESHIHLTNGRLEDMASGLRYDEVSVDHNRDNRILTFRVPLGFSDLEFNYKYNTIVNRKENSGDVEGKIDRIELDLKVVYDAKHGFAVDGVHIHDRGELTVEFSGHNLDVDVIEAITHTVKTHLAPLLEEFTEKHIDQIADKVVEKINDFIHDHDDHNDNDDIPDDDGPIPA